MGELITLRDERQADWERLKAQERALEAQKETAKQFVELATHPVFRRAVGNMERAIISLTDLMCARNVSDEDRREYAAEIRAVKNLVEMGQDGTRKIATIEDRLAKLRAAISQAERTLGRREDFNG